MKPSEIPGLFDFVEPEPLPTIGESRAEFERERAAIGSGKVAVSPDPVQFRHARHPGRCFAQMKFWTGRIACEPGPVEIEHNADKSMTYVLEPGTGRMIYPFTEFQMDEFRKHFCFDDAVGGEA